MRIKIEPAKKSTLYNIFTPEGFAFSISAKGIFETGLSEDKDMSPETVEAARAYAQSEKVFQRAVYYLGFRDYSAGELLERLARAGMDGTEAVAQLQRLGYVDDEKYADKLIEKYASRYGKRRIDEELRRRKISKEIREDKLAGFQEDVAPELCEQIAKKMRGQPFEDRKQRDKVYAFLVRRGYAYEDIKKAFRLYNESIGDM